VEKIQVSCEYILDRKTSFTIEIEGYLNRNDMSDYYSDISYANKSNLISGAIGVNHEISEGFRTAFIYQYSENKISAENVKSGQSSNYFQITE
jgi:outer membrane protein assembly factor BamA